MGAYQNLISGEKNSKKKSGLKSLDFRPLRIHMLFCDEIPQHGIYDGPACGDPKKSSGLRFSSIFSTATQ